MSHLLSLAALHAAAPGVLGVVFGRDGEFEGAPMWEAQLWFEPLHSYRTVSARYWDPDGVMLDLSFDLRVPSVAARLAGLCLQAARAHYEHTGEGWPRGFADGSLNFLRRISEQAHDSGVTGMDAERLAAIVLAMAPRIRALAKQEP